MQRKTSRAWVCQRPRSTKERGAGTPARVRTRGARAHPRLLRHWSLSLLTLPRKSGALIPLIDTLSISTCAFLPLRMRLPFPPTLSSPHHPPTASRGARPPRPPPHNTHRVPSPRRAPPLARTRAPVYLLTPTSSHSLVSLSPSASVCMRLRTHLSLSASLSLSLSLSLSPVYSTVEAITSGTRTS